MGRGLQAKMVKGGAYNAPNAEVEVINGNGIKG